MNRLISFIFIVFFATISPSFSVLAQMPEEEGPPTGVAPPPEAYMPASEPTPPQPLQAAVNPYTSPSYSVPLANFFDRVAVKVGVSTLLMDGIVPKTFGGHVGVALPFAGYGRFEFSVQGHYPFMLPSINAIVAAEASLGLSIPLMPNRLHLNLTAGLGYFGMYQKGALLPASDLDTSVPQPSLMAGHYMSVPFNASFLVRISNTGLEITPFHFYFLMDPTNTNKFGFGATMMLTLHFPVSKRSL